MSDSYYKRFSEEQARIITKNNEAMLALKKENSELYSKMEMLEDAGLNWMTMQDVILENPTIQSAWENFFVMMKMTINEDEWDKRKDKIREKMDKVSSENDERVVNNTVRHQYRVLTEEEKASMVKIKDIGLEFINLIETMEKSRENSLAITKMEEAVMWAVKSLTK